MLTVPRSVAQREKEGRGNDAVRGNIFTGATRIYVHTLPLLLPSSSGKKVEGRARFLSRFRFTKNNFNANLATLRERVGFPHAPFILSETRATPFSRWRMIKTYYNEYRMNAWCDIVYATIKNITYNVCDYVYYVYVYVYECVRVRFSSYLS